MKRSKLNEIIREILSKYEDLCNEAESLKDSAKSLKKTVNYLPYEDEEIEDDLKEENE